MIDGSESGSTSSQRIQQIWCSSAQGGTGLRGRAECAECAGVEGTGVVGMLSVQIHYHRTSYRATSTRTIAAAVVEDPGEDLCLG